MRMNIVKWATRTAIAVVVFIPASIAFR